MAVASGVSMASDSLVAVASGTSATSVSLVAVALAGEVFSAGSADDWHALRNRAIERKTTKE
jgi:hypothetical protein